MDRGLCVRLALSLLLLAPSWARGEAPVGWSLRLGSGISVATGDFGLAWGTGGPVAVALGAGVAPRLEIGADVAYQNMDESIGGTLVSALFGEQAELTMWRIGARGRYALNSPGARWLPHLIGGVALHPTKIDVRDSDGSHREFDHTGFGVSAGGGLDYRLSPRWALGMESVYYWVKSDEGAINYSTTPYLDFNLGLSWKLGGA